MVEASQSLHHSPPLPQQTSCRHLLASLCESEHRPHQSEEVQDLPSLILGPVCQCLSFHTCQVGTMPPASQECQ